MEHGLMKLMSLTAGLLLAAASSFSIAEPALEKSVREYFSVSGLEKTYSQSNESMIPIIKQSIRNVPDELLAKLIRTDRILDSAVPIYQRHFSEEEMQELIEFYRSPVGTKYANEREAIFREAKQVADKESQEILKDYYTKNGNLPAAYPKKVQRAGSGSNKSFKADGLQPRP